MTTDAVAPTPEVVLYLSETHEYGSNYLTLSIDIVDRNEESKFVYDHYLTQEQIALREIGIRGFVYASNGVPSHMIGFDNTEFRKYHPTASDMKKAIPVMQRLDKALWKARREAEDYSFTTSVVALAKVVKAKRIKFRRLGQKGSDLEAIPVGGCRARLAEIEAAACAKDVRRFA